MAIAIRFFFPCVVCFSMASFTSVNKHSLFSLFLNHPTGPAKFLNVLSTRRIFSVLSPHVAVPSPTMLVLRTTSEHTTRPYMIQIFDTILPPQYLKKCHLNLAILRIILNMSLHLNKPTLVHHQNVKKRSSFIHILTVKNSFEILSAYDTYNTYQY